MNIRIAENIKQLRKERKLTQEQLAEALGVTTGAVHKWESGASLPEIRMLVELAELFGVSVDVMLGYEMINANIDDMIERITDYINAKELDSAVNEAEKALLRYPNSFKLVRCCAEVYQRKGIEMHESSASERAIELLERSIILISQNDDPEISEQTIRSEIAVCHIAQHNFPKAIEIMKKYNAGGINNAMLAMTCGNWEKSDTDETESYLSTSFSGIFTDLTQTISGYVNYNIRMGDIKAALEGSRWFAGLLDSLKADSDAVCYLDRLAAPFEALSASFLMYLGRESEAEAYLRKAFERAKAFDAAPVYSIQGVKFVGSAAEKQTASDDLGETAMLAVERIFSSDERNRPVLEMWEHLKAQ